MKPEVVLLYIHVSGDPEPDSRRAGGEAGAHRRLRQPAHRSGQHLRPLPREPHVLHACREADAGQGRYTYYLVQFHCIGCFLC